MKDLESIVFIKGNVRYGITLDPGVWIFDDRKVNMETYFHTEKKTDELEEYAKAASIHWQREISEGAVLPPTLKTEKKYEKEKILTGSFGIPFAPFLENAEADKLASKVFVETNGKEIEFPIEVAKQFILGFSIDGKPLKEDGPIHVYFGNGENLDAPITDVTAIRVE